MDVEFYFDDCCGYVWLGGNEIYVLDDYLIKWISIFCCYGEFICYGVWVCGWMLIYWGVGY